MSIATYIAMLPVALKPNTVFRIGLAYLNKLDNNSFIIALAFPFLAIGQWLVFACFAIIN